MKWRAKWLLLNYVTIPFAVSKTAFGLSVLNRMIVAVIPMLQIMVTAYFVDTVMQVFSQQASENEVFVPLTLLILIVLLSNGSDAVMNFVNDFLKVKLSDRLQNAIVEKRAKLDYSHIERDDTWELVSRVGADPVGVVAGGFWNILLCAEVVVRVGSVLGLLVLQVWWAALVIVLFSAPLLIASLRSGKSGYHAFVEMQKYNRKANYMREVLSDRQYIEERALFGLQIIVMKNGLPCTKQHEK